MPDRIYEYEIKRIFIRDGQKVRDGTVPRTAVFKGKFKRDRKQQQPIRTSNDKPFSISLSARHGCFRLEIRHKTSTVRAGKWFAATAVIRDSGRLVFATHQ
jgi:hypothetical protein